jgi:hypothetical protein
MAIDYSVIEKEIAEAIDAADAAGLAEIGERRRAHEIVCDFLLEQRGPMPACNFMGIDYHRYPVPRCLKDLTGVAKLATESLQRLGWTVEIDEKYPPCLCATRPEAGGASR